MDIVRKDAASASAFAGGSIVPRLAAVMDMLAPALSVRTSSPGSRRSSIPPHLSDARRSVCRAAMKLDALYLSERIAPSGWKTFNRRSGGVSIPS